MRVLERLKALLSEELLLEAKNIGYLKNKFPKVNNIERYLNFDPTYEGDPNNIGQYSEWIVLQVNRGNIKPSDESKIHELLTDFGMQLKRNTLKGNDRSILSYKTVDDLANKLDTVKGEGVSNKVSTKNVSAKPIVGTEIVYADDDWTIYTPYTFTGSRRAASLGGDRAAWCTANPSNDYYWKNYSSKGPLYIIVNNNDNNDKYQVNISFKNGSGVLDGHMDRNDYPFNFDAFLSDKPEMKKFFDNEFHQDPQEYFDKKNEAFYKQLTQDRVYDGDMYIDQLHLTELPDDFTVNGDLIIKNTKFKMPKDLTINGKLVIGSGVDITELNDVHVTSILNLLRSPITHLGENVTVDSYIITPDGRGRFTTTEKFSNVHKFNRYMQNFQ